MALQCEQSEGRLRVSMPAEFTIYGVVPVKDELLRLLSEAAELDLDLSAVTEFDSAALQVLALVKREALAAGKPLRLTGHSGPVVRLIDLYRLSGWFGDPVVLPGQPATH
jgi:anti-anti-sigma factor